MYEQYAPYVDRGTTFYHALNRNQQLVVQASAVIAVGMVLYVPKTISVVGTSQSAGYMAIWETPQALRAAQGWGNFFGATVHLDLGRMFFQFVVLAILTFFTLRFLENEKSPSQDQQ